MTGFGRKSRDRNRPAVRRLTVPQYYWEDFTPGDVAEIGPRVVTREEIIAFASEFDPQPFHLDEDAGRVSVLGGLAASGWHTCCIVMRMISDGMLSRSEFLGAPGVEEVRWHAPLLAGTEVRVRTRVLDKRVSRSRPEMGFVGFAFELIDANDKLLMTQRVHPMFGLRNPASAPSET